MKNKKELELMLDKFQVEELEKRYEMGWSPSSASVYVSYNNSGWSGSVRGTWPLS